VGKALFEHKQQMPKNSAKERPIMAQNAESKALAEELEQEEETSILENKSDFQNFPRTSTFRL
jgi:hypothetical protein